MTDYSVEDLERIWNAQPDPMNTWDELGIDEIVAFAQQVARQWQPIETVPRDGTDVLLGWWSTWSGLWITKVNAYSDNGRYFNHGAETHWMPLPEPPQ